MLSTPLGIPGPRKLWHMAEQEVAGFDVREEEEEERKINIPTSSLHTLFK